MTITSADTRTAYAGDGTTTSFAIPWQFFGPDELRAYSVDADDVQALLERGLHYTVTGGVGATGTLVMGTAPATGTTLVIRRSTTATQQIVLPNAGPLPGPSLERALDRLTAIAQENQAAFGRTLRVPDGEADQPPLPARADRASMNVITDADGNVTVGQPVSNTVSVSAPMIPVVGAAALRTARLTLGGPAHVDLVRDHNADNTGTADCAAALQAAIDSLTSGVVYLRPGSYRLNSDVTLKPGVTVIGDDPLITTLVAGAANLRLLKYVAAAPAFPFTIRRLGFSAGGFSNVYAVHLDGTDVTKRCSFVSLEDLYITGGARGINLRFCASTILDTIRCTAADIGIYTDTCTDTEVNGGYAQSGGDYGIYITGSGGAADEGVRVTAFNTNGQVRGGGVSGQDWGSFIGCAFTNCSGGPLTFINAENWKVASCDLSTGGGSPATPGVQADANCRALQLVGNRAPTNTYGIDLQGEKHVVLGNHLAGNTNNDIRLRCTRSVVQGNLCDSTGVAVSILESGAADFNMISGNVTNGTVTVIGAGSASNGNNVVY